MLKILNCEKVIDPKKLEEFANEAFHKDQKDSGRRKKMVKRGQKVGATKKTATPPRRTNRRKRRGDTK